MMEDNNEETSISEQSIIAKEITGQSLVAIAQVGDQNHPIEVGALNFSPPRQILLQQAQSPVVHLQKEFDDVDGYDSDGGPFYGAVNEEGPLI
jgi:hypothetical protein